MNGTLLIGDYAYSSWSLRGWLLFNRFDLSVTTRLIDFSQGPVAAQITDHAPARTVPTWLTPEGAVISESLAIAEELHSRVPQAGLWPQEPRARATARSLATEMHAGFGALRQACPMALRVAYRGFAPSEAVLADLARLEALWRHARAMATPEGPWLFGAYSVADAFFAPVAARIATYDLPVGPDAAAYVAAHLADPAFRRWRAMGLVSGTELARYRMDLPQRPWPGPAPRAAHAQPKGPSINPTCPYSGKPSRYFLELDGRIWGFCNAFCRDKTVADPEAWPQFRALL